MSYSRPPTTVKAGRALTQSPSTSNPPGVLPVTLDTDIASTGNLGVVQVGTGLTISPAGILSATSSGSLVGNWTPVLSASGAGVIVLNVNNGKYSKVGQSVTCTFDMQVTSILGGSGSNTLKLTNLPFTSVAGTGYVGSLYFSYFENMDDNIDYISGSVIQSSTALDLWFTNQQAKSMTKLCQGTLKVGSRLVGSIEYISNM